VRRISRGWKEELEEAKRRRDNRRRLESMRNERNI